jgi:ABC-type transporter Mla subunit MlaD
MAMQEDHSSPRRFAGVGKKVSLFFATAVLGVIGVIFLVSYKQGAFVRHTNVHFYAADAFGINKGMAVKLFGLPVGSVSNMDISDRGVRVDLAIISDYAPRIPKGSRARLLREGYIGAANIQLVPNMEPGRALQPVAEGDELEFAPAKGVAELVDDLKNQLTPVINDLRKMIVELNHPDSDFRRSFAGARTVMQELPETNRELRQTLRDADRALVAVGRVADQQLPVIATKLSTTLDSLSATATQMGEQTRKNGDALHEVLVQVPGLLRESGDLVRDGRDVVGAARNNWLLGDMFETKSIVTLPVDSFESSGAGTAAAQAQR